MALASAGNGTQTASISTEHTLATITSGDTAVLQVDASNMTSSDTLVLRAYIKVSSGGSSQIVYEESFSGVQSPPVLLSVPVPGLHEVKFTLEQTAGTGRDFDWEAVTL